MRSIRSLAGVAVVGLAATLGTTSGLTAPAGASTDPSGREARDGWRSNGSQSRLYGCVDPKSPVGAPRTIKLAARGKTVSLAWTAAPVRKGWQITQYRVMWFNDASGLYEQVLQTSPGNRRFTIDLSQEPYRSSPTINLQVAAVATNASSGKSAQGCVSQQGPIVNSRVVFPPARQLVITPETAPEELDTCLRSHGGRLIFHVAGVGLRQSEMFLSLVFANPVTDLEERPPHGYYQEKAQQIFDEYAGVGKATVGSISCMTR